MTTAWWTNSEPIGCSLLVDRWRAATNHPKNSYGCDMRVGDVPPNSPEITIVTIGKDEENWKTVLTLPNLEELTLHEPTREQLQAIGELQSVKLLPPLGSVRLHA